MKTYLSHLTTLVIGIIIFAGSRSIAQGSWEKLDLPTVQNLNSVFFTDSLYGWVAGDSGTILHTTDGGSTWVFQAEEITEDIVDVFFLNRNYGWATAFKFESQPYGTLVLKTTNGGKDWSSSIYPENNIFMNCVLFLDSLNGWMGGSPHAIVSTSDGGGTWETATVDTSTLAFFPVLNIQFYNENYGYACGGRFDIAGVTWRTSNGGNTWYALPVDQAPADEVHQLYLFDSITVMGAGGDPDFGYGVGMLNTNDGGYNWFYNELSIQGNAYDLAFRTQTDAWAPLGPGQKMIYSQDAGLSWDEMPTPESAAIYKVHFPDSLHGFAVGRDGAMIKFIPPVPVGIQQFVTDEIQPKLFQNTPNPFSGKTMFRFEIPSGFFITNNSILNAQLFIFNAFGKLIEVKQINDIQIGMNQFLTDCSELPAGIYFYKLAFNSSKGETFYTTAKKMVLLN